MSDLWMKRLALALAVAALLLVAFGGRADASWVPLPPQDTYTLHYGRCPSIEGAAGCAVGGESYSEDSFGNRTNVRVHYDIWVSSSGRGAYARANDREVLLHELGHVFDTASLSDTERQAFLDINGYQAAWEDRVANKGSAEFPATPQEIFADSYAYCGLQGWERHQLGYSWRSLRPDPYRKPSRRARYRASVRMSPTVYDWTPTHDQARATCRLIRGAP